eukprot:m51a1_g1495 hypothetical protein (488) ;mRNA; r:325772-327235
METLSDDVLVQVLCQLARCSGAESCAALGRASLVCRQWRRAASAAPRLPWSCALFRTADTRTRPPPRWFCGAVRAVECSPLPVWSARAIKVTGTLAAPAERPARRRQQPGEGGQREGEGQHEHEHEHEALVAAGYGANLEAIEVDPLVTPDEAVDAFVAEHVALCPRLAALRCPFGPRTLAALAARPASWARVAAIEGWPALEALPAPGTAQCRVLDGALRGVVAWDRDTQTAGGKFDELLRRWGPQLRALEHASILRYDSAAFGILLAHAARLVALREVVFMSSLPIGPQLLALSRALPSARSVERLRVMCAGSIVSPGDEVAQALRCFSSVTRLSIDCDTCPEVLAVIRGPLSARLRALEIVFYDYGASAEDDFFECVGACAALEKLVVLQCPTSPAALLRCLAGLRSLTRLMVSECIDVFADADPDTRWIDEVLGALAGDASVVPHLSWLRIMHVQHCRNVGVLRAARPWLSVRPCRDCGVGST